MTKIKNKPDFETSELNKDQIATFLLKTAKKRNLLYRERKKFITNQFFSSLYTIEALSGIMHETISKVVNAHEAYVIRTACEEECQKQTKNQLIKEILKNKKEIINKSLITFSIDDEDEQSDEEFIDIKKVKKTELLKTIEVLLSQKDFIENLFPDMTLEYSLKCNKALNKKNLENKFKKSDLINLIVQFKIPNYSPNISENLDLSTLGNITGYFINAFSNNISKDYKKYTASKREGELVSYDTDSDISMEDQKESITVFNQLQEDSINDLIDLSEYQSHFKKIFYSLKSYDKKMNVLNQKKYPSELIPINKKSNLAHLFLLLIDPKYKGKYVHIKEKMDISQYIFNSKKEEIVSFIKKNFKEEALYIYNYISKNYETYGENLRPKRTENFYDQSCTASDSFEVKFINKRIIEVIYKVELLRLNNGRWESLESKEFSKRTIQEKMDETKSLLKSESSSYLNKYQLIAEERRINASKEIYAA